MAFFYILVYIRNHFLTSPYLLFRMYWNEGHKKWYHFCVVPLSDMALPPFLCTLECWSVKDWRWCCRYHYHFAFCTVCGGYWMISQNLAGFHCHTTCRTHLKKIKIITQVKIPFQRACTYVGFPSMYRIYECSYNKLPFQRKSTPKPSTKQTYNFTLFTTSYHYEVVNSENAL